MTDKRYHVVLKDQASGEELGVMLVGTSAISFSRNLVNPYATKMGGGETKDSDLTEWSMLSWRDWRTGRGQENLVDPAAFLDAWNLETRIANQLTLGPLPQNPGGTLPRYEPGNGTLYFTGWPGPEVQTGNSGNGAYAPILGTTPSQAAGQRFLVKSSQRWISSIEVRIKKAAATTGTITLSIYADGNGFPTGAALATQVVAAASVTTAFTWVTFALAAPLAVSEGYYWIALSTSDVNGYAWNMAMDNPYMYGLCYAAVYSQSAWSSSNQWRNFDMTFKVHFAKVSLSQGFAPVGDITCTSIQLYLSAANSLGAVTVGLYANAGGAPTGAALASKVVNPSWAYGWYEVIWGAGVALTAGTTYHIVVTPNAEGTDPPAYDRYLCWSGASGGGYAGGICNRRLDSGAWAAQTQDLYFRVNRDELDGPAVAFARYDGKWYCGAGDSVYEWDTGTSAWTTSDHVHGKDVTSLETWGGYLWAGRGASNVLRKYSVAGGWAAVAGVYANLLKAGGGYLHASNATVGSTHEVLYTADGTAWAAPIEIGVGDHAITALAWFRDMLVVANAINLWAIAAEMGYPVLDWSSQEDVNNGKSMLVWGRTGCLYIPLRFGLYRWNGDSMIAVGPEQGTGLPSARSGYISAMVGTNNWLFVVINAGSAGTSSILAYSGMGGWHELQRADQANQAINALDFEVLSSPSRLWFGLGNETRYLQLPDYSDNPYQWTSYEFNAIGELEMSWSGGELLEVTKDFHEVVIRGEDFAAGQTVTCYYEVDRCGHWTYLGQANAGVRVSLPFAASPFGYRMIGTGSTTTTIELQADDTTEGVSPGDWVGINAEIRQISTVPDTDTFVLYNPLSAAPAAGDFVYASKPAGREFRLKLVLATTDRTATPKITAVFLRYQANVLDRYVYKLSIKIEDGLTDLAGNPYPYTAAQLRGLLDTWSKRVTSFSLYDPDGTAHTVKVSSAAEGGYSLVESAGQYRYRSEYIMTLIEV